MVSHLKQVKTLQSVVVCTASRSVPALQAFQSHQQHPEVQEVPGIQEVQQVLALLSHQQGPTDGRVRESVHTAEEHQPHRAGPWSRYWYLQQVQRVPGHQHLRPFQVHPG